MKRLILFLSALSIIFTTIIPVDAAVRVRGYYRKNGTYVQPHYRSNPDGNPYNNYSTYPNVNPYTGKVGTKHLQGYGVITPVTYEQKPLSLDEMAAIPKAENSLKLEAVANTQSVVIPIWEKPDFSQLTAHSVVRIIDGDTIVVKVDANEVTVRLIGVDTPETVHPSKPVEEYGKEASLFNSNLLKGERIYVVVDPQQGKTDRYGRSLAYAYRAPDGLFVNAEIIRQGYGHAYTTYPFKYMEEFRQIERFARQSQKGLWASETATTASKASPIPHVLPSAVKVEPKTESTEADITVYVTRTGAKYHRGSCRYLSKSKIPISLKESKARYSPCSVCNPPQ